MCFFPQNPQYVNENLMKYGIVFECGSCPECLAKRSRLWALRCSMELKYNTACMITLTYDTYIRDEHGVIIGEEVADRNVDKRDAQLFIKRLRRSLELPYVAQARAKINAHLNRSYRRSKMRISKRAYKAQMRKRYAAEINRFIQSYVSQRAQKIKYLLTAEYGKRLHKTADGRLVRRPHYHALIFGYQFPDLLFYKTSKRGNKIYKSHTLERLWNHGICTVDAKVGSPKIARYCTKYCAKDSRSDDTFMLVSRDIGTRALLEEFNGISYIIEGREYPIPKLIWNKVILQRYAKRYAALGYPISTKYVSQWLNFDDGLYKDAHVPPFTLDDCSSNCFVMERRLRRWRREISLSCPDSREAYLVAAERRARFQRCRDRDKQYIQYVEYWRKKFEAAERVRPDVFTRVLQLPNEKYFSYKQAALKVLSQNVRDLHAFGGKYNLGPGDVFNLPPRSNCIKRAARYRDQFTVRELVTCLTPSRHNKTSNTQKPTLKDVGRLNNPFATIRNPKQTSIFDFIESE